ncbi:hypothetical protein L4C36_10115 [Photobacterium japonica]|uniref:hypothetical protein n=1 Tax=Photobacterium japonica TaxID=2910235 RepID=UPI003D0ECD48
MHYSKPFPGQSEHMFKDKFSKWPRIMRALVLLSLLPPALLILLVHQQLAPVSALHDVLLAVTVLNVTLLVWGLALKIRARKYWYRSYHIGKTMVLAAIPIMACGYIFLTELPKSELLAQPTSRTVQLTIN